MMPDDRTWRAAGLGSVLALLLAGALPAAGADRVVLAEEFTNNG